MKIRWICYSGLMFLALASTLWMQQGCVGSYAPLASMVVTSTPTLLPNVVSDFETGTTAVYPTLRNVNGHPGFFSVNTYGGSPPNSINNPFVLPNPGNGSNYAIHILCSLSGTGAYEADQLVCTLTSGGPSVYYDAGTFTGIQFDLNILPADTNPQRVFQVAVDVTTPTSAPGGICSSSCYNHYQAVLPAGSAAGWVTKSYNWNQIIYPGYGTNNGPDVSTHLNKILFLQWSEGANGAVTTTQTNFWIDNVKFLP